MKNITSIIFLALVSFLIFYFALPVINLKFLDLPIYLLLFAFFGLIVSVKFETIKNGTQIRVLKKPNKIFYFIIIALLFYIIVLPLFTSLPMFRSESFRNLIGKVKDGKNIATHIEPISLDKIRVVDQQLAYLLGEKIMGNQPALGSQVELGEFNIQKVNDKLYWVAPLLHSGFFKWMNNSEGTPGYVMVSVTNERDVKLVQQVNGKDIKVKYQPNAYFNSLISRHIYINGYMTMGLTDYTFEIDESGKPFWVVTTYDKKIGFTGNDATGVVVVDVQTGVLKHYTIANTPKWVDRIQPSEFVESQLNDWGEYVNGYWNFSNLNKLQTTEGLSLVYGNGNKSYWYTGLTSVGKDESAVGFVLVDTQSKETTFYKQGGATEYAAQKSAEGKVQEKGYRASLPIPYNVNSIPTYIMTLKDAGGLVKMYAMVSVNDYTIVGVGNSLREALTAYKSSFNMAGNKVSTNSISDKKLLKTIITRIQTDVQNGNSFYYFKVKDHPKIFIGSTQISTQLPLTSTGDSIKISFDMDNEEVIDVSTFENITMKK